MDLDLPAEDDPRRVEVRNWFAEHPTPTPQELVDAGYVVPHWPKPYGLDAEPELQLIIDDEMRRAGVRRAPVVDSDDDLIGVLSIDDVLDHLAVQLGHIADIVRMEQQAEVDKQP